MNVTYWCSRYGKPIAQASGPELAKCKADGQSCAVCNLCALRKLKAEH